MRAGGEGGTTPALGAVVNAVVDALRDYGVTHMDMPLTPEKIWRAIRDGKAACIAKRDPASSTDSRGNERSKDAR